MSRWWLNIYCVLRDGVISNPSAPLTRGRPGVTALAMISGEEIDGISGIVEYTKEGYMRDMPLGLLGNQCPIRVLRGSRLKSKYAPKVGVRYDGLWVLLLPLPSLSLPRKRKKAFGNNILLKPA